MRGDGDDFVLLKCKELRFQRLIEFRYLGSTVPSRNVGCGSEVKRRAQAGLE